MKESSIPKIMSRVFIQAFSFNKEMKTELDVDALRIMCLSRSFVRFLITLFLIFRCLRCCNFACVIKQSTFSVK